MPAMAAKSLQDLLTPPFRLDRLEVGEVMVLQPIGVLDTAAAGRIWGEVFALLAARSPRALVVDAAELIRADPPGLALLIELRRWQIARGHEFVMLQPCPDVGRLFALALGKQALPREARGVEHAGVIESLGAATRSRIAGLIDMVGYVGDLTALSVRLLAGRAGLRWGDTLAVARAVGVAALPLIVLLGFLIGLITAFQSAIPLKQFGADLFVANLVGLSLLRELGPLLTAVILAGRSGSAFAAEIGTMKVNEELDALTTMGLDPMRFLVLPRVLAGTLLTPLLSLFLCLAGLIGAGLVMLSFGYPPEAYVNQLLLALRHGDLLGGLAKAVVFGFLVSAIGCRAGLATGSGAASVGAATTRAVVLGIVAIILADGLFAVVYYALGW